MATEHLQVHNWVRRYEAPDRTAWLETRENWEED